MNGGQSKTNKMLKLCYNPSTFEMYFAEEPKNGDLLYPNANQDWRDYAHFMRLENIKPSDTYVFFPLKKLLKKLRPYIKKEDKIVVCPAESGKVKKFFEGYPNVVLGDISPDGEDVVEMDIMSFPECDWLFCSSILEHLWLPDIIRVLKRISTHVKSGSVLRITHSKSRDFWRDATHVTALTSKEWLEFIRKYIPTTVRLNMDTYVTVSEEFTNASEEKARKKMLHLSTAFAEDYCKVCKNPCCKSSRRLSFSLSDIPRIMNLPYKKLEKGCMALTDSGCSLGEDRPFGCLLYFCKKQSDIDYDYMKQFLFYNQYARDKGKLRERNGTKKERARTFIWHWAQRFLAD